MALGIFTACLVASMGLFHHFVHLVPMPAMVFVMLTVVVLTMVAMEFFMALMVAFLVAETACLVAGMGLLEHWALCLRHPCEAFGALGKLLIHPLLIELGALVTFRIFACCVAYLYGWPCFACFEEWGPWLGALGVALSICPTFLVACMGFLHLLMHLLTPMLVVTVAVVMVVAMVVPVLIMMTMVVPIPMAMG